MLAAILICPIQVFCQDTSSIEKSADNFTATTEDRNFELNSEKSSNAVVEDVEESSQIEGQDNKIVDIPPPLPPPPDNLSGENNLKLPIPEADVASGALTYQIKIPVPAGRMGIQPDLNLVYNSLNNELGGSVGYGWELSLPSIERRNVNGVNKLYISRDFTSTMDGELREQAAGTFFARVDTGSAFRYEFLGSGNNQSWKVTDKQGKQYVYGESAESKLSNPNDDTKIFRWHLTTLTDRNGNSVDFVYQKISGQVYVKEIYYTNHKSLSGVFKVTFEYENRPDPTVNANPGFLVSSTKRLIGVRGYFLNQLTNETQLSYIQHSVNNRTLLHNFRHIGYNTEGQPASQGVWIFDYDSIGASGLLAGLELPTGGKMLITYTPSAQMMDSSTNALGNSKLPYSFYLVETIEYQAENVNWQNEFQYTGGSFYYRNPFDRRVAGFERVIQTDGAGNTTTTYYHQGNGNNLVYGESGDSFEKLGYPYKVENRSASGDLYTQTLNKWEYISVGSQAARTQLKSALTRTFDGDKNSKDSAVEYMYDTFGNTLREIKLGEVSGNNDGTYNDLGSDTIISEFSYAVPVNPSTYVVGLFSQNRILDANNQKQSESFYYYDGLSLNSVDKGNSTKVQRWIAGANFAETTRSFNGFGQVVEETDPNNHITIYTFDQFNLYAGAESNALNQTTQYAYDYSSGKVKQVIDPNGHVFETDYDGLDRIVEERQPNPDNPSNLIVKSAFAYNDQPNNVSVKRIARFSDSLTTESYIYFDGFGRTVQERIQAEQPGQFAVCDLSYNDRSLLEKKSLPYFSAGSTRTQATTEGTLYIHYTYDSLDRILTVTNSVGTFSSFYNQWKTTVTDPMGKQKVFIYDAFNQLVSASERIGVETNVTRYDYNALGNLIRITDAQGNLRNFTYDGLGRRKTTEDLHSPSDTTFGVWQFAFDAAGNLIRRIDPKGQTVDFDYDELNRVKKEDFLGNPGIEVTYFYDSCRNGIGRLCGDTINTVIRSREYNALGLVNKETVSIFGTPYVTENAFDFQGNLRLLTNPDGSQVRYDFNQAGFLESLSTKELGQTNFKMLVSDFNYTPPGNIAETVYGSGTRTLNTYDANELYRLKRKFTDDGGAQVIQDLNYTFDAVGNVRQIKDNSDLNSRKILTFLYDDLHRLTYAAATKTGGVRMYRQNFSYDALGNITYKSDQGSYQYNGNQGTNYANPNAVTNIGATSLSYDKNGNLESVGTQILYTWDYNNRLRQSATGSLNAMYTYTSDGERVARNSNLSQTVFPTRFYSFSSQTGIEKHIFAGDLMIATIKGTGQKSEVFYNHTDHLNSANVITREDGTIAERLEYYPFGSILHDTAPLQERRKFAGHEYDGETSLSYMVARYYDGEKGKFLSQDPLFVHSPDKNINDPQQQNSYAYSRNNPIRYIDPNGEEAQEPGWVLLPWEARTTGFINRHPIAAWKIGALPKNIGNLQVNLPTANNISVVASNFAINSKLTNGTPDGLGSQLNAFRHVMWQALITKQFGTGIALEAGNVHEANPYVDLSVRMFDGDNKWNEADQTADLLNNRIGRTIGAEYSKESPVQLAVRALDYYYNIGVFVGKEKDGKVMVYQHKIDINQYNAVYGQITSLDKFGKKKQ